MPHPETQDAVYKIIREYSLDNTKYFEAVEIIKAYMAGIEKHPEYNKTVILLDRTLRTLFQRHLGPHNSILCQITHAINFEYLFSSTLEVGHAQRLDRQIKEKTLSDFEIDDKCDVQHYLYYLIACRYNLRHLAHFLMEKSICKEGIISSINSNVFSTFLAIGYGNIDVLRLQVKLTIAKKYFSRSSHSAFKKAVRLNQPKVAVFILSQLNARHIVPLTEMASRTIPWNKVYTRASVKLPANMPPKTLHGAHLRSVAPSKKTLRTFTWKERKGRQVHQSIEEANAEVVKHSPIFKGEISVLDLAQTDFADSSDIAIATYDRIKHMHHTIKALMPNILVMIYVHNRKDSSQLPLLPLEIWREIIIALMGLHKVAGHPTQIKSAITTPFRDLTAANKKTLRKNLSFNALIVAELTPEEDVSTTLRPL